VRHEETDLSRREELAGALSRTFRKFPEQVFVCAAQEIRLNVREAKPITRIGEGLDDATQFRWVDVTLILSSWSAYVENRVKFQMNAKVEKKRTSVEHDATALNAIAAEGQLPA
jgi:hypothetical protein